MYFVYTMSCILLYTHIYMYMYSVYIYIYVYMVCIIISHHIYICIHIPYRGESDRGPGRLEGLAGARTAMGRRSRRGAWGRPQGPAGGAARTTMGHRLTKPQFTRQSPHWSVLNKGQSYCAKVATNINSRYQPLLLICL